MNLKIINITKMIYTSRIFGKFDIRAKSYRTFKYGQRRERYYIHLEFSKFLSAPTRKLEERNQPQDKVTFSHKLFIIGEIEIRRWFNIVHMSSCIFLPSCWNPKLVRRLWIPIAIVLICFVTCRDHFSFRIIVCSIRLKKCHDIFGFSMKKVQFR